MLSEMVEEDPEWERLLTLKIFRQSVKLISTTRDLTLNVEEDAIRELESIDKELNVVAITGLYRTGKSVLLNQLLAGKRDSPAFGVGHATAAMTSGIWATCVRHPVFDDQVLLLLDTEGLGDIKKGDKDHDNKIFTIATLLSSTLIYNILGPFNQDALEKLTFITQQSQNVVLSTKPNNEDEFILSVFPNFVLCMRDFFLDLEGRTPKHYLEDCLENKDEGTKTSEGYNKLRKAIKRYFRKRECFKFSTPTDRQEELVFIDSLKHVSISEGFKADFKTFTDCLFNYGPKRKLSGEIITGKDLATLARTYVKCILDGAIPSVGDAMMVVADKRNRKLVDDALESFISNIKNIPLPEDNATLLDMKLQKYQDEEIQTFQEAIIYDLNKVCLTKLKKNMHTEWQKVVKKNESILFKQCIDELERLHTPIARDVDRGLYAHKMGYHAYTEAVKRRDDHFRGLPESFGKQKETSILKFHAMKKAENEKVKADASAVRREDALEADVKNLKQEVKNLSTQLDLLNRQRLKESKKSTDMTQLKQDLDLMKERVNWLYSRQCIIL